MSHPLHTAATSSLVDRGPHEAAQAIIEYAVPCVRKPVPWWMVVSASFVFLGCGAILLLAVWVLHELGWTTVALTAASVFAAVSGGLAALEWRALERPAGVSAEVIALGAGALATLMLVPATGVVIGVYHDGATAESIQGLGVASLPLALLVFIAVAHVRWSE